MAWETRQRGSRYYVSKERHGNKVRSVYAGSGPIAELCECWHMSQRHERNLQRADLWAWKQEQQKQEAIGRGAYALVDSLLHEALTYAGYHRHKRGKWRKKRMTTEQIAVIQDTQDTPKYPRQRPPSEALSSERTLLEKCVAGDKAAFREFCEHEDEAALERFFLGCFDLMFDIAENHVSEKHLIGREALRCKMRVMKRDLGADTAPPLEKMLIERIVTCWMDLTLRENSYRQACAEKNGGTARGTAETWEKMLDSANRRYLASVKALAEVRKLNLPDVTMQAIEQQVNVVVGMQANMGQAAYSKP